MAEKTSWGLIATGILTAIVGSAILLIISGYKDFIWINIKEISYVSILLLLCIGLVLIAWIRSLTFVSPIDRIEVPDKTASKNH